MIITVQKRTTQGLCFGSRAQRDIDQATILSDARYLVLPDRDNCIICGRHFSRTPGLISTGSTEG